MADQPGKPGISSVDSYSPLLDPPHQPTTMPGVPSQTATYDSQASHTATSTSAPRPLETTNIPRPRKTDTFMSWGTPAGLAIRSCNDENLLIFRKALGINVHREAADCGGSLEEGRHTAVGIYRNVIQTQSRLAIQHGLLSAFLYIVYFLQIIIGAVLTSIGAAATRFSIAITVLGALNTVLAGILALIKGSGQPQKLGKDRIGYRRLQDWIEETEALLAVGVIGRNRREVGLLVESAFKRYNAAKASEENNDPDFYVYHKQEPIGNHPSDDEGQGGNNGSGHEAPRQVSYVE